MGVWTDLRPAIVPSGRQLLAPDSVYMAEDGEIDHPGLSKRKADSLPASPGRFRVGVGRRQTARMTKKLLYVLLAVALSAAALAGLTSGASAEQRTVTVELANGTTTTVTGDVP